MISSGARRRHNALVASLETEPGISAVAVAAAADGDQSAPFGRGRTVHGCTTAVGAHGSGDVGFFEALGHRVVAGRDFTRADLESGHRTAIVNTAFVTRALEERISSAAASGPARNGTRSAWYEIVGVVGHLGVTW
jgi:hypothetical protein